MNKSLLIIDDKENFIKSFQITAQRKGYQLASGHTLDDLKEKVPKLHREITTIVLDIKALLNKEQSIENENFIGAAITWLDQNYPDLPRIILSGDEKALESFSRFYPIKDLLVFKKETEDIEKMFQKIEEFQLNHENRIKTDDERRIFELIAKGESDCLEFKSSFQYCTNDNVENRLLRYEVLKTLVAFSNSDGGSLLIGVEDNGNIIGLEETDFTLINGDNKTDKYKLLLDGLVSDYISASYHREFKLKFYDINGKTVCQLKVDSRSKEPIFLRKYQYKSKELIKTLKNVFFLRRQASSERLDDDEKINEYIQRVWS